MSEQINTTPTFEFDESTEDFPYQVGSASTNVTVRTNGWSPQSELTSATTPSATRSPARFMEYGPQLLPKVREQDQAMAAVSTASSHVGHSRTQSLPCNNGMPVQFGAHLSLQSLSAGPRPRSISPGGVFDFGTPIETPTDPFSVYSIGQVRKDTPARSLAVPVSSVRSHSRHSSSSSIDAAAFSKYHFPTYRQSPGPQQSMETAQADAMSHLVPLTMPQGHVQSYPTRRRHPSPPVAPSRLSVEIDTAPMLSVEQTTLHDYLTQENPVIIPMQCDQIQMPRQTDHAWFDVRNVIGWTDFTVERILSYDGLARLLVCPVDQSLLHEPERKPTTAMNRSHLADTIARYHLVKLNAALALTQGASRHLSARHLTRSSRTREQPEFVSNYTSDTDLTIDGDGRGRIVGIVRGFDEWNSGMRGEDANRKIQYLRSLAVLHKHMRDHRCRYGFIMNEIELVCVRAGGPTISSSAMPLFGFLELAAPIPVSRHVTTDSSDRQMTVGIALWWLHMLARDEPLPGQPDWQLRIGNPASGSRHHHHDRDDWIPQPNGREKRTAKNARGWIFPDEPVCAKERGRARRTRLDTSNTLNNNRVTMSAIHAPTYYETMPTSMSM